MLKLLYSLIIAHLFAISLYAEKQNNNQSSLITEERITSDDNGLPIHSSHISKPAYPTKTIENWNNIFHATQAKEYHHAIQFACWMTAMCLGNKCSTTLAQLINIPASVLIRILGLYGTHRFYQHTVQPRLHKALTERATEAALREACKTPQDRQEIAQYMRSYKTNSQPERPLDYHLSLKTAYGSAQELEEKSISIRATLPIPWLYQAPLKKHLEQTVQYIERPQQEKCSSDRTV